MYSIYKRESQATMSQSAGGSSTQFDEQAALGIIQHLDKEELQRLLDNENKLKDLIDDLQMIKNLQVDREMLMASNKSLADYNLGRKPRLEQAKGQLAASYEQAVQLRKDFDQNKQKLDFLAAQLALDTTLAVLQTEAAKSEDEAENLAEDFLNNKGGDVDEFLEQFITMRTTAHARKTKAEKMQELIRNNNASSAANTSYNQQNYPAPVANNWPGPTPYPTGQFGMPDPGQYLKR